MDYKQAEKRYKFLMTAMVLVLLLSILPMGLSVYRFLFAQISGGKTSPWHMVFSGVCLFVGVCAAVAMSGPMKKAKEIAMYDEFGVRRDTKGKLSLNSSERQELERQALAELEKILPKSALERATHTGSENPDADLESMVGIAEVKRRVLEMKARMDFEDKMATKHAGSEGHHMVFTGNPGTGKTSIARIITGFLYEYEYIDENKIVEVDGNFLKGTDSDTTQVKVRYLCRYSTGGVLFIDEAYSLAEDDIGLLAISTLIKEMEDRRGQFVVIFAGYTGEITSMLDANPGFRSRIKEYFCFEDYTSDETYDIFCKMASDKGFKVLDDSGELKAAFLTRIEKERALPSWGNARTVRNILEEAIDHHAYRVIQGEIPKKDAKKMLRTIQSEDISKYPKETV